MESKVIVIVGPTCSGKTALSLSISEKISTEIISADSRQIYKYLNIGTAKPNKDQLKKTKHHFIDVLEPDEDFNVSKFEHEALDIIRDIFLRNKIPLVVGGSGLYVKALIDGIFNTVGTDEEYRKKLHDMRQKRGNEFLFSELKKVDPDSASKMLPQNWKRVMRALEVFHLTGKPIGLHQNEHIRETEFEFNQYGLMWDRNLLYRNIEKRVDEMISLGLVDEVKKILDKGYSPELNSLNSVGYKEVIEYLNGQYTLERTIELIKRNTRRYAKRQLTWYRRDTRIKWIDVKSKNDIAKIAERITYGKF